MNIFP